MVNQVMRWDHDILIPQNYRFCCLTIYQYLDKARVIISLK